MAPMKQRDTAPGTRCKRIAVGLMLGAGLCAGMPVQADDGPVIVIPGRAGVPVMMNGRDVSYAVVEGDWGLGKSVHVQPTVTYYYYYDWAGMPGAPAARYYPRSGRVPGYGRHEIEPSAHRALPPPAESYTRVWGIESAPTPATDYPPYAPPQVSVGTPESYGRPADGRPADDRVFREPPRRRHEPRRDRP